MPVAPFRRFAAMAVFAGLAGGSVAAAGPLSPAEPVAPATQRVEVGGLALEFALSPTPMIAGQDTPPPPQARLRFTDAATGAPARGIRPAAWMQWRRSPAVLETPCEDRARQFAAGSLGNRADIDLNTYRLVTLNQDATIAFINPHVRIRNSRLEAIVTLPGRGHDWVHAAAVRRIAVTLRDEGRLVLVDAVGHRIAGEIDLGTGSLPTRLVVEPDGRHAWVGLDGRDEIVRIDLLEARVIARLTTAAGPHLPLMIPGRGLLAVVHAGADRMTLIDPRGARVLGTVALDAGPIAIAWSDAAQRLVVLAGRAGRLHLIEVGLDGARADRTIDLEPGALSMATLGDGRHLLVGNVSRHELSLIDLASGARVDRTGLAPWPDQIVVAGRFAYVRSQTSNRVTLIDVAQARAGKLVPVAVTIGRGAPSDDSDSLNVAPMMTAAPEGHGIYAAVAADRQIYRYSEGLMVPSGSLTNYRRAPRALMVIDESLRELEPGVFEAPVRADRSGTVDVVVRNASPAATACFSVAIDAGMVPQQAATPAPGPQPRVVWWRRDHDRLEVAVALIAPGDRASVQLPTQGDLTLLALIPGTGWQRRIEMTPSAAGHWSASVELPAGVPTARVELLVRSDHHAIAFTHGRLGSPASSRASIDRTEVARGTR